MSVPILENLALRTEQTFSLVLKNPGDGANLGLHDEITVTIAPRQFLAIRYSAQAGSVRLTLSPTTPGIAYELRGFSDFRKPWERYLDDKVATGDSLDFYEYDSDVTPLPAHRFYTAFWVGPR